MVHQKPRLVVLGGPMDGLEFAVDQPEVAIGRMEDQAVRLPLDWAVSRRHARLTVEGGEYWLEDVNSSFGTFVGGSEDRIEGRVRITPGTTFRLGPETTLKLIVEDVEKKMVQRADRLIHALALQLPEVSAEKWVALKVQLVGILHRLDGATSEEEVMASLRDIVDTIEKALGTAIVIRPPPAQSGGAALPAPEQEGIETLKSFFKSNLSEILNKMEEMEADGSEGA